MRITIAANLFDFLILKSVERGRGFYFYLYNSAVTAVCM